MIACAGAIVRDADARLLLVLRAHDPARGTWSLPGGRVEAGETAAEAAKREVQEETGLIVDVAELLTTVSLGDYIVEDFAASVIGGELRAGDDASDVRWCAANTLEELKLSPGLLDELRRLGLI